MALKCNVYPGSNLASLRQSRDSFVRDVLGGAALGSGPTLPGNAFDDAKIAKRDAYLVLEYAKRYFQDSHEPGSGTVNQDAKRVRVGDVACSNAILDILTGPVETKPTTELGIARAAIRKEVGWSSTLATTMLNAMVARYGDQWLSNCHVIYSGHGTGQMLPFFPLCGALGLRSGGFRLSNASGDKGVYPLFNVIMASLMSSPARDFNLASQSSEHVIAELLQPRMVLLANGGQLLTGIDLPPAVLDRIAHGEIRFYLHNAADKKSYAELEARYPEAFATAVSLNGADSIPKQIEFSGIGDQLGAHGDDASRRHNHAPISQSTAIIFGVGTMGPAICQSLIGSDMSRENIVLVDTHPSPEALAWASERGLTIHRELPSVTSDGRKLAELPHGVVYVATNCDGGLDEGHLDRLPKSTVVINTNSEGRGVAVDGIYGAYRNIRDADRDYVVYGLRDGDQIRYADMVCERRERGNAPQPEKITFVNARFSQKLRRVVAYSPNLSETTGQERLHTAVKIFVGVCSLADPELRHRPDGQPHPYPMAPSLMFRNAAVPALTYQGPPLDAVNPPA